MKGENSGGLGGYSITALCVLPKDETGVQFPLPAHLQNERGLPERRPAFATLAQLVEQCFRKAEVPSSILGGGSKKTFAKFKREFFCFLFDIFLRQTQPARS